MSSLAATQADGYYLSPEYYESGAYKKQSKNQWYDKNNNNTNNNRPTGGYNQCVKKNSNTVRFELPYNGICQQCNKHIKRGTRYNASKTTPTHIEKYYHTTPIIEFHMQCRACNQCTYIIRTDPATRGFIYVTGISECKQQQQDKELNYEKSTTTTTATATATTTTTTRIQETKEGNIIQQTNATKTDLERLESIKYGERQSLIEHNVLQSLQNKRNKFHEDDANNNAILRTQYRRDRHTRKRQLDDGKQLGWKHGMILLDTNVHDKYMAQNQIYDSSTSSSIQKTKWKQIQQSSIFDKTKNNKGTVKSLSRTTGDKRRCTRRLSDIVDQRPNIIASCTTPSRRIQKIAKSTIVVDLAEKNTHTQKRHSTKSRKDK